MSPSTFAEPSVGPDFYRPDFPLEDLRPSPLNPRKTFDVEKLKELSESILSVGVIEPLVARPCGDHYELVCGERRFRAAQAAGLTTVPVTVKSLTDAQALEIMVIENNQREDVNPIEEADGFARLLQTGWHVEVLAARLGRSKKYVYDRVKLLQLVPDAQQLVLDGTLTAGHAILLARCKPDVQQKALERVDYDPDGIWEWDDGYDVSGGLRVKSVRALEAWIDDTVRIDFDREVIDPTLFPDAAAACESERPERIVSITFYHAIADDVPNAREILKPSHWKRADGSVVDGDTHPACPLALTGIVVIGRDRGAVFKVCIAESKCKVHWPKAPASAERQDNDGDSAAAKKRREDETRKWREKQEREQARRAQFAAAAPHIFSAFAERVLKLSQRELVEALLEVDYRSEDRDHALQVIPKPKTATDAAALLVLQDVAGAVFDQWTAPDRVAFYAKRFSLDVKPLLKEPVQTSARPATAAKKKGKKR